jgi:hypothetical protein
MTMKRDLAFVAAAFTAAVALAFCFNAFVGYKPLVVDGTRLITAARAYRQSLEAQGQPVPPMVRLEDLVRRGYLRPEDIQAFGGLRVTISLAADDTQPQEVLVCAQFPNGDEVVTLADGSVQRVHPKTSAQPCP